MICLHHAYETPFIKFTLDKSTLDYQQLSDHAKFAASFGSFEVTDMTLYPDTLVPQDFPLRPMKYEEIEGEYSRSRLAQLRAPNDVEMIVYGVACPLRSAEKTHSFVVLRLREVRLQYQSEMFKHRVRNYVLCQLVASLTAFDAFVPPQSKVKLVRFSLPESYVEFKVSFHFEFIVHREQDNGGGETKAELQGKPRTSRRKFRNIQQHGL